jgi:hypothetical protein
VIEITRHFGQYMSVSITLMFHAVVLLQIFQSLDQEASILLQNMP